MSPERYARIRAIFEQAAELPRDQRVSFVHLATDGDEDLEAQVLQLLAADDVSVSPLDNRDHLQLFANVSATAAEYPPGYVLGNYTILRPIGRGGMGTVYLASRNDQSFKRRVAIKVSRVDLLETGFTERLMVERQLLARLDHPNIARLLDGGASHDGRPYYVMEYVPGLPITRYCTSSNLSVTRRLELFSAACDAVAYAHRNLIVHRDLKPSNILVRTDGTVKLLDFGIAKLMVEGSRLLNATRSLPIFTPQYASPEQFRGEAITTATDIYSLGAILYELLSGQRPFDFQARTLHDIAHMICETEPVKPSIAAGRRLTPDSMHLSRALKGDLDTIALKALRRDAKDRYLSVADLREDITRHVKGHVIQARPPTFWYRASKLLRRQRNAVAVVSLATLLALGASISAIVQTLRASQAARKSAYISSMVAANALIQTQDYEAANHTLRNAADSAERGWEWKYLYDLLDTSTGTLYASGDAEDPYFPGSIRLDAERGFINWNSGNVLHVWNLTTFQRIARLSRFGHIYGISPHGRVVVASGPHMNAPSANMPLLFDAATGREIGRLNIALGRLAHLAFDDEGGRIATAESDGTLKIWDGLSGALVKHLTKDPDSLSFVAFVPGSNELLLHSLSDSTLRIVDCKSGRMVRTITDLAPLPSLISLAPGGHRIAVASRKQIIVSQLVGPSDLQPISLPSAVTALTFGLDESVLFASVNDGRIFEFDIRKRTARDIFAGHRRPVTALSVDPTGNRLFSADGRDLKSWDLRSRGGFRLFEGLSGVATAVAVSADGSLVAASYWTANNRDNKETNILQPLSTVEVWDASGRSLKRVTLNWPARIMEFSKNNEHLAIGSMTGPIDMVSLRSGTIEWESYPQHPAQGLTLSDDGTHVAAIFDRAIQVYKVGTADTYYWPAETVRVCAAKFLDNQYIATIGDKVRVWTLFSLHEPGRLTIGGWEETRPAVDVDVGTDPFRTVPGGLSGCGEYGNTLASVSHSGRVVVSTWRPGHIKPAITVTRIAKVELPEPSDRGSQAMWQETPIQTNGRHLIMLSNRLDLPNKGDAHSEVREEFGQPEVWDLTSGQRLLRFGLLVNQIAASEDGKCIAVRQSGKILVWHSDGKPLPEVAQYVEDQYRQHVTEEAVLATIRRDSAMLPRLRQSAIDLATARGERDVIRLAKDSIELSVPQGRGAVEYKAALVRAQVALRAMPLDPLALTAAGVMEYRFGLYSASAQHLAEALREARHKDQVPAVFYAMAQYRLGKTKEARELMIDAERMQRFAELYDVDWSAMLEEAKELIKSAK